MISLVVRNAKNEEKIKNSDINPIYTSTDDLDQEMIVPVIA